MLGTFIIIRRPDTPHTVFRRTVGYFSNSRIDFDNIPS